MKEIRFDDAIIQNKTVNLFRSCFSQMDDFKFVIVIVNLVQTCTIILMISHCMCAAENVQVNNAETPWAQFNEYNQARNILQLN